MESSKSRRKSEVMQNMLEALIRYEVIQEDEITGSADSTVTIESLWKLVNILEEHLSESTSNQNKELLEVQKYVEHVRQLSEERDQLTAEFEQENEKLKLELKQLKSLAESEATEISDMCRQENLEELVGSSFSEQMAYLLVVRGTLMDKMEVMEERCESSSRQCQEMKEQVKLLTSEDGELRHRMESAMSEMGGMASKLTDSLKERDALKKEAEELRQALDAIQTLPTVNQAKAEASTRQNEMENMKQFYTEQINDLREELEDVTQQKENSEAELTAQVEELEEVNEKLKEVNRKLNDHLTLKEEDVEGESRKLVAAESQKIIEEMQRALDEDEAKNLAQQEEYELVIDELKRKISDLENAQYLNVIDDDIDVVQLKAQMKEAKRQLDGKHDQVASLQNELNDLKREMNAREVATESKQLQFETQVRISTEVQQRNADLEAELTKSVFQLKEAFEKLKKSESEREKLEFQGKIFEERPRDGAISTHPDEVQQLKDKIVQLESLLLRETSGSTTDDESSVKMNAQLAVCEAQIAEEKKARQSLHEKLVASQQRNDEMLGRDVEMQKSLEDFQQRALKAEAQVYLITGQKDEEESQKLVAELSRNQLEDAVEMLRKRMDLYILQLQAYVDRYKNLKQKHKTKIRRIRELFLLERKSTTEEVEQLERKLAYAENALKRELAWKERAVDDVKSAERDRRNAISEADRTARIADERSEQIKRLNSATDDLVSEKGLLQKQLILLQQQKQELENIVEIAQQQNRSEELTHLLSSLSMSGSLPYMGSSDLQPEEREAKNNSSSFEKQTFPSKESYLNLSPTKPHPAKRSLY